MCSSTAYRTPYPVCPVAFGCNLAAFGAKTAPDRRSSWASATASASRSNRSAYKSKVIAAEAKEQRPGLAALLDYARPGDTIVVVGIDRLGRNAAEVMLTIRELRDREIVLRSLREGIDTSNATGRMIAGVLASLDELELELGRERRAAAKAARKARGMPIGRPRKLSDDKLALAERMRAGGEPVPVIAATLRVSTPTLYRLLAERAEKQEAS